MHQDSMEQNSDPKPSDQSRLPLSFGAIREWILGQLAMRTGMNPVAIDPAERFQGLGLDSMGATALLVELGKLLGRTLSPTLAWNFPTPNLLARHLAEGAKVEPIAAIASSARRQEEPIAIIGMACRFPKAPNLESFWQLLREGGDAITEVPKERWDIDAFYDPDPATPGKMNTRRGGFLSEVDTFDAAFFGISPREAVQIDPQQRLALELSWEALEDARIAPASLRDSRTGVFFGAVWMEYVRLLCGTAESIAQHTATGMDLSIISARVSYSLGLSGPSLTVNAACSSASVGLHLAVQSLLRGESQLCVVGGINLMLTPESTIAMSKFGGLSPDGRSKAFDARANGYVRGEGGAVVVLKRLSEAQAAGDRIYCVIRGSAVNNDGFSNGLTSPNPRAQEAMLREACAVAGVEPTEIEYVEAHGTGTLLGDPIEAGALGAVLGAGRPAERPLRIGSVKTNIGHLEAAAGLAGLIKVALSMQHRALPKSLHFERPNPHIPFEALRLQVLTELTPWAGAQGRLLAGVSSFGYGGTNCHVVVEASTVEEPQLFVLSAESEEGLRAMALRYAERLAAASDPSLETMCRQATREVHLAFRLAVMVRSRSELGQKLRAFGAGETVAGLAAGKAAGHPLRVAMLFTGQGAQYSGMGRRLYETQPVFRAAVDRCVARLAGELPRPLLEVMWAAAGTDDAALLHRTCYTQPALFTVEYALAELWRSLGVEPELLLGHSIGELVAACVSGVLSLDDALRLVAARGKLMDALPPGGAMFALATEEAQVASRLAPFGDQAAIAAVNGPSEIVISGDEAVVTAIATGFAAEGVRTQPLKVSHAFHSPRMAPMRDEFRRVAEALSYRPPRISLVSNLDGRRAGAAIAEAAHWVRHVEAPVRFIDGLSTLATEQVDVLLEAGPHPVLLDLAAKRPELKGARRIVSLSRGADDPAVLRGALGQLFVAGVAVRLSEEAAGPGAVPQAELFGLSARSEEALSAQAGRLRAHLHANPELALCDVAFSLLSTRSALEHRLALPATSREELQAALAAAAQGQTPPGAVRGRIGFSGVPKVVFVFPGQGSQWLGMGQTLLAKELVFREALCACDRAIQAEAGFSVLAELLADQARSQLHRIDVVQPVLFAMAVALSALWRSWGVEPDAVVGHSLGEVAAAHVAGVLSLDDAAAIICRRSRLLRRISGHGEMAMVELSRAEAEQALLGYESRLSVAVCNSPRSTVLAGEPDALSAVLAQLEKKGVFCRRVKVDVASHSPQVEPLRAELLTVLRNLRPGDIRVPMWSTVTGLQLRGPELVADYWADNLRQPVRFGEVVEALLESGHGLFIEMSPHPILVPAVQELQQAGKWEGVAVGSLRRGQEERSALLDALGALWVSGYPVAWARQFPAGARRVSLPTYAWQRQRYWADAPVAQAVGGLARAHQGGHPLLGEVQTLSTQANTRLWETMIDLKRLPWLGDHRVQGAVVFPGAAYLEMALLCGNESFGTDPFTVTELSIREPLVLSGETPVLVQGVTMEETPGRLRFQVASRDPRAGRGSFLVHARGLLRRAERGAAPARLDLSARRARLAERDVAKEYAALRAMGLEYGPAFQGIAALWQGEGEALGRVLLPQVAGSAAGYQLHPALLDACLQVVASLLSVQGETTPWVPVEVDSLRVLARPAGELFCHVRIAPVESEAAPRRRADLWVVNSAGAEVAELHGLLVQRLASGTGRREEDEWFLGVEWEALPVPSPKSTAGRWLLLGDGGAVGSALRAALSEVGQSVVHAREIPPSMSEMRELMAGQTPTAVVHLGSLGDMEQVGGCPLDQGLMQNCESVLHTVQALASLAARDMPRLWLLTRGAQALGEGEVAVAQGPLLGLGRCIALEHAELRCGRLDLDPARPPTEVRAVLAELLADDKEDEIALRGGERRVARLVSRPPAAKQEKLEPAMGRPFRLEVDQPGVLDHLVLRATERRAPGPGEVEIAVEAAGLNFLDVLLALGVMPNELPGPSGEPPGLGSECAGRIVAVGEGVQGLSVGDHVVALAYGAFTSHVTTPATLVLPRLGGLSAAAAAALPIAYLTAYYALDRVAHLKRGERVLIHAATGGVGLAAVQWAQHIGAEIYATAGNPEKRAYLESLGVRYVSDSRSDRFVADILSWTGGEGVDVVLNSLSGEFIEKSFQLLRDHGRFVELGKRDYYANHQLGLKPFLRNLSFSLVDLRGMILKQPARVRALFQGLLDMLAAGTFSPLPLEILPIGQAGEAFRRMAQARHIGKLVLTLADPEVRVHVPSAAKVVIRSDSTYLVTGGLGGLGLSVAGWLAAQGAGHLMLVGRSGAASAAQQAAVADLKAQGTRVTVAKADVAQRAELEAILREIGASGMPLRGVIHAAGLLDDGMLVQQTPARFRTVLLPKVQGAMYLHELTRKLELDFFVLYASGAGLLGSAGQGNYAAANTFLDALAHHRRAQGLPALSIDWGGFSEVGLAAAQDNRGARLAARGMRNLRPEEGLRVLSRLLEGSDPQVGVVPLNLRQWAGFYQGAASSPRLSRLWTAQRAGASQPQGDRTVLERLAAAEPAARSALMQEMVCAQVAQVLRIPEGQLNREAPFRSLGLDSLMGLELRNRIESVLGIRLSATILWNYPTVAALSRFLAAGDGAAPPEEPPPSIDLTAEVNAMSRDELTQMIAAEFEELKDE